MSKLVTLPEEVILQAAGQLIGYGPCANDISERLISFLKAEDEKEKQTEGDRSMKKFWMVYGQKNNGTFQRFETYQDAEDMAKRMAAMNHDNEFVILESVSVTKQPVPQIEIIKL